MSASDTLAPDAPPPAAAPPLDPSAPGLVQLGTTPSPTVAEQPAVWWREKGAMRLIGLVMLAAAIPRAAAAIIDHSIFWPDEYYQTVEQANRIAFGFGIIPWEFREGARSWFFPGVLAGWFKVLWWVGIRGPGHRVIAAKLLMAALGLVGVGATGMLAARLVPEERQRKTAWLFGALFLGFAPPILYFGPKVMTENASGPLLVLAALWSLDGDRRRQIAAGALSASTIYLRYQNGLFAVGLLIFSAWKHGWRAAVPFLIAATSIGLAGGALDWVTWGTPFKAFIEYLDFNIVRDGASGFGTSPWTFFFTHTVGALGAPVGLLLFAAVRGSRRAKALAFMVVLFIGIHAAVPHKELRFLLPLMPFVAAMAGVGMAELLEGLQAGRTFRLATALVIAGLWIEHARTITFGKLGQWVDQGVATKVVWHSGEDYFHNTFKAGQWPELCGIAMVGNSSSWVGGLTWVGKSVPVYWDLNSNHWPFFNAIVGHADERLPPGYKRAFSSGEYVLFTRDGGCTNDPGYKPWL